MVGDDQAIPSRHLNRGSLIPTTSRIVARIRDADNPAAFAGGYVGKTIGVKFPAETGKISNAHMWDAIFSDGDMYKGGVGGQGLYVSPPRDMVVVCFATDTPRSLTNLPASSLNSRLKRRLVIFALLPQEHLIAVSSGPAAAQHQQMSTEGV
ncbi:hypothetical protein GGD81_003000 [Rhodobium orientis]|uniref:hypothetical protein n=1 Tax=Rhodobium orientis TaxID=34017 RepID=UPI0014749B3C|nr:hypothetical protein [Rhodobium orientis]MBB4303945.1 hypothetical protein [Rhodobium orientis]